MQKLRFLLPLLILTLAVVGISLSVRSYRSDEDENVTTTQSVTESESPESEVSDQPEIPVATGVVENENTQSPGTGGVSSPTTEKKGLVAKIISIFRPQSITYENKSVSILLPSEQDRPTAYTIKLKYNPSVLTVESIESGDLWDRVTVLKKEVNNTAGTATISAGQSLGTQNSSQGTTIATVVIKVLSSADINNELTIEDSSGFAYVGLDSAVPLKSKSLEVKAAN
jgi:hypothetical protein